MFQNLLSELFAARRIARVIIEAARDPLGPALSSAGNRAPHIPPGTPDVFTQVNSRGQTQFDAIWDGDSWDDTGAQWAP